MRITKYIHACLLVEEGGEQLLFDPGVFSFNEGLVDPALFGRVSTVIVTHAHPDHLDVATLRTILGLSGATVLTNGEGVKKLAEAGIGATALESGTQHKGAFTITAYPAPHASVLGSVPPQNTAYLINDTLLNPGDSFDPSLHALRGKAALVLPAAAPWNTELMVAAFAEAMAPRAIIPVHDGYMKPFFLKQRYDNYVTYFGGKGITFHRLAQPGDGVDITV